MVKTWSLFELIKFFFSAGFPRMDFGVADPDLKSVTELTPNHTEERFDCKFIRSKRKIC